MPNSQYKRLSTHYKLRAELKVLNFQTCTRVVVLPPPFPPSSSSRILTESDMLFFLRAGFVLRRNRKTDDDKKRPTGGRRRRLQFRISDKRVFCLFSFWWVTSHCTTALHYGVVKRSVNNANETWTAARQSGCLTGGIVYYVGNLTVKWSECGYICENKCTWQWQVVKGCLLRTCN